MKKNGEPETACVNFDFNAWGEKYPPWSRDAAIPKQIAGARSFRCFDADFVLEGGSVDCDGQGTLLTTQSCLLNSNRGVGRTREQMEQRLRDWLCAERILWLEDGIVGDDTDGHIDDIARFVAPGRVVAAEESNPQDPNYEILQRNLERLRKFEDAHGRRLEVISLPMPAPLVIDAERLPASYVNFYLANATVLVPVFEQAQDQVALSILKELFPDREVIGISAQALVVGLGAVHCLTQQEPRAAS